MSKVFVTQEAVYRDRNTGAMISKFDLTPAGVYGEIEFLTPAKTISLVSAPIIKSLKEKLRHFSDDDFILPAGDPVLIAMCCMVAGKANLGRVKMLKWDKPINSYIVIQINTGV